MGDFTRSMKAVRKARSEVDAIRAKIGDLEAKLAKVTRLGGQQDRDHAAALAKLQQDYAAALIAGEAAPEPDAALVARARQGDHAVAGAQAARAALQAELAALHAEEAEALARLSGAVFTLATEMQAEARREAVEQLASLAPAFGRLIALDEVRRRYIGERLKLTTLSDDRPWSGAAVVRKLIGAIPDQLSSPSISFEQLSTTTKVIVDSIVAQIEGES